MTLKFADPSYAIAGKRIFSASVNGNTTAALQNIDVAASAGGQFKPWDVTVPVSVRTDITTSLARGENEKRVRDERCQIAAARPLDKSP